MSKSKEEQERVYYDQKLIREGVKDELKKQFSWKLFFMDFIQYFLGLFIGRCLIGLIGTEELITSAAGRFIAEVLILAAMIGVVRAVFAGSRKLLHCK